MEWICFIVKLLFRLETPFDHALPLDLRQTIVTGERPCPALPGEADPSHRRKPNRPSSGAAAARPSTSATNTKGYRASQSATGKQSEPRANPSQKPASFAKQICLG